MRVESKVEGGRMEEKDRHGIDGGSEEVVAGKKGFALHPCLHRMCACREERRQPSFHGPRNKYKNTKNTTAGRRTGSDIINTATQVTALRGYEEM